VALAKHQDGQLLALLTQEMRENARTSLSTFCQMVMPSWQQVEFELSWYHELICQFLKDTLTGSKKKIIITMPPRSGKSQIISRLFPAFLFGIDPNHKIIGASYSQDLAASFNRDINSIMESVEYRKIFPLTKVAPAKENNVKNQTIFQIHNHRGEYRCGGTGGSFTGFGADTILIDDPFKNAEQANSAAYREKVWDWYTSTILSRLEKNGRLIVTATRWHEDDLSGRLLNNSNEFHHLHLPALAFEDTDPERSPYEIRQYNEPLWPSKFSATFLEDVRKLSGPQTWSALYQGVPTNQEGAILKPESFKRYALLPSVSQYIQTWDLSFKGTTKSDYNVGQVWARDAANFYLVDQVRFRGGFTDTCEQIKKFCARYPKSFSIYIEDKANGPAVIDELKKKIPGIKPWKYDGDKVSRVNAISNYVESGNVHVPESASWLKDFLEECLRFPHGANDDQVDALAMALMVLGKHNLDRLKQMYDGL
jgi:predicted phage terminase large subunit-like protein